MPRVLLVAEKLERADEIARALPAGTVVSRSRPAPCCLSHLVGGKAFSVLCVLENLREREWAFLGRLRETSPASLVVVCTNAFTAENAVRAMKMGVCEFLDAQGSLSTIIKTLSAVVSALSPSGHYLATRLDRYIAENLNDVDLSLSSVSQRFAISESYASKLLNREIGMSFRRRLAYHRHVMARHLLRTTSQHVGEVAAECGYRRHSRLCEIFGRLEGMPPMQYRRRAKLMEGRPQ